MDDAISLPAATLDGQASPHHRRWRCEGALDERFERAPGIELTVIAGAGVRSGVIAPDVFLLAEDKVQPAFPGTDQLDFPVQLDRIPATVVNDYYLPRRCRLGQNTGHCRTHKWAGL
jgi:hypothetical protein